MRISARLLAVVCFSALVLCSVRADDDALGDVKARMKVEAERVEKEYKEGRAAAYKLVRSDAPKLVEATEKISELLAMVEKDRSLSADRRKVIVVTLKWDLDKVAEIAAERKKAAKSEAARVAVREQRLEATRPVTPTRRPPETTTSRTTDIAKSILESRGKTVIETRRDKVSNGDKYNRVLAAVDKAAVPETQAYLFPDAKKWKEITEKRSAGVAMTKAEKAIMKALESAIEVDYAKVTLEDVLDNLRKRLKVTISADKRAMEEVGVSYESEVNLKLRASTRTVLKRVLADLNLTYVIKDEAIQITSRERAKEMTTIRTYYLGDLAAVVDIRLDNVTKQLLMLERVNTLISTITSQVDKQSWKVNNPDATGTIVFDPVRLSLIVKQTAEVHFQLGGK